MLGMFICGSRSTTIGEEGLVSMENCNVIDHRFG